MARESLYGEMVISISTKGIHTHRVISPTLIRIRRLIQTMNLFRKAGEKFEETKQAFVSGSDAEYVCHSCEKPVEDDYQFCPHCGEESVEPVDEE